MFRSPLRVFAVLMVSLTLTTPLCEAASRGSAPGRARQATSTPPHLIGLWDWLTSLWATDGGCGIDPNGLCAKSQSLADGGCTLDPDGRCVKGLSAADGGCGLDPGGLCAKAVSTPDGGCILDPNGNTICSRGHS
jgi:hypothetical protein